MIDVTGKSEEAILTALHDCNYDTEQAILALLDTADDSVSTLVIFLSLKIYCPLKNDKNSWKSNLNAISNSILYVITLVCVCGQSVCGFGSCKHINSITVIVGGYDPCPIVSAGYVILHVTFIFVCFDKIEWIIGKTITPDYHFRALLHDVESICACGEIEFFRHVFC